MAFQVLQRARAVTASQATSTTVTLPGATTVGSRRVLLVTTSQGAGLSAAPTGFTQRGVSNAQQANTYLYDKVTASTSETSVTVDHPLGGAVLYLVEAVGVVAFTAAATANAGGPVASVSTGNLTPNVSSGAAWLVALATFNDESQTLAGFSAPLTLADQAFQSNISSRWFHNGYADGLVTTSGATSATATATGAVTGWELVFGAYQVEAPAPAFAFVGGTAVSKFMVGATQASAAYVGTTRVWP